MRRSLPPPPTPTASITRDEASRTNESFDDEYLRLQDHGGAVHRFLQRFFECVGKLWPWVKDIAEEVNLLNNLRTIVGTAREAGIKIYHVPHHRWGSGDYVNRKYPSPYQLGAAAFAKDTWGGTFHDDLQAQPGDIVATEHWASSGFPNTDLEHKLKRYGKEKIICIGLLANTCLEATARIGMELGFHVTLFETGQQPAHMRPCMPCSTSTDRPLPMRS
jgi:nicotinamidase-related amidase